MDNEDKLVEISKFRGEACWVQRGKFFYVVCRRRRDKTYYRCGTTGCATGFVCGDDGPGPLNAPHDHSEEPWIPDRNMMFRTLRDRTVTELTSLQTIYNEEAARRPEAAAHLSIESVMASMRKWRQNATRSDVPGNLRDFGAALASRTGFETMYLCTVTAGGWSAVVLVMPGWADCLQRSDVIIADGGAETVPAQVGAEQVLALHTVVGTFFYHPVVVLLESRRQILYEAVLRRIWREAGEPRPGAVLADYEPALQAALQSAVGVPVAGCYFSFLQVCNEAVLRRIWREAGEPRPGAVLADYEPALQAALQSTVGVPVAGCYFSFLQDLKRQARLCGIQVSPSSAGGQLVRLYGSLALLPPAAAPLALPGLRAAAEQEGLPFNEAFHTYFIGFWMNQIGPELFSVHGQHHRTSNAAEALHKYLIKLLGLAPNVWRFTHVVQQKFEVCAARRRAQLSGAAGGPRRARACSMVRRRAAYSYVKDFERGRMDLRQFLISSSRLVKLTDDSTPVVTEELEVLEEDDGVEDIPDDITEILPKKDPDPSPSRTAGTRGPTSGSAGPRGPVAGSAGPSASYDVRCSVCVDEDVQRVLVPCGHILCYECVRAAKRSDAPDKCSCCGEVIQMHAVLVR